MVMWTFEHIVFEPVGLSSEDVIENNMCCCMSTLFHRPSVLNLIVCCEEYHIKICSKILYMTKHSMTKYNTYNHLLTSKS